MRERQAGCTHSWNTLARGTSFFSLARERNASDTPERRTLKTAPRFGQLNGALLLLPDRLFSRAIDRFLLGAASSSSSFRRDQSMNFSECVTLRSFDFFFFRLFLLSTFSFTRDAQSFSLLTHLRMEILKSIVRVRRFDTYEASIPEMQRDTLVYTRKPLSD